MTFRPVPHARLPLILAVPALFGGLPPAQDEPPQPAPASKDSAAPRARTEETVPPKLAARLKALRKAMASLQKPDDATFQAIQKKVYPLPAAGGTPSRGRGIEIDSQGVVERSECRVTRTGSRPAWFNKWRARKGSARMRFHSRWEFPRAPYRDGCGRWVTCEGDTPGLPGRLCHWMQSDSIPPGL